MNRKLALGLAATTVLVAACADSDQLVAPDGPDIAPSFSAQQQTDRVVGGRVLARLVPGADADAVAQANGVTFERQAAGGGFGIFRGAVGSERALAARIGADANVVWAEPDYLREITQIDPKLWAFYNPGGLTVRFTRGRNKNKVVTSLISVDDADEDNIGNYAAGGAAVSIASIDTGVDFSHPEFGDATLVAGWDFYDNDSDPSDTNDHGTHTTGTMAGDNVGVAGVSGAALNVTVYVYRVCGSQGCPSSAIADAITAATNDSVVAMNLSLGGGSLSQAEADAIDYAVANGSLVIASAGNNGSSTVACPACDPGAISVAASDWLDEHAYYTQYGDGLDITAPGGELYSNTTEDAGIWSSVRGGAYAYFQGTSMAAPQVTGTAAIVASVTGLNGAALRSRIEDTADDFGDPFRFGHGRLNSYRAVTTTTLIEGPPPPPPPPNNPPSASFTHSCTELSCDFTDTSTDSDGTIDSYDWDFGDGGSSTAQNPSHTYAADGTYPVTLTVTDNDGATDATSQDVTVSSGGGGFTLSAVGYKVKGRQKVDLSWSGATSTNVDIHRDGALIDTTENDGFYTDNIDQRGGGSYEYQVCEAGTSTCSNTATVIF